MKKRLATLAILGAMTVSAVAPMSVFAAESETEVKYITGAVTPGGGDAGYYVTIPSDIMFQDTTTAVEQKLELKPVDAAKGLPYGLEVGVGVASAQGAVVNNATYGSLKYEVDYTANDGGAKLAEGSTGDPTDVVVGTLKSESTPSAGDQKLALTGQAKLLQDAGVGTPKGTEFVDTLTYTITQN